MRRFLGRSAATALSLACCMASTALAAQDVQLTGTVHITWVEPVDPREPHLELPTLVTDAGRVILLDIAPALLAAQGGTRGLEGRRVILRIDPTSAPAIADAQLTRTIEVRVNAIERLPKTPRLDPILLQTPAASMIEGAVTRHRLATLLCKYADATADEPRNREEYVEIMSAEFPNAAHYWNHVSDGQLNIDGSQVYGWYTLPRPRAEYATANSATPNTALLLADCMAAADGDVHFPSFDGINVQVNGSLGAFENLTGVASVGFSSLDAVQKVYKVVLFSSRADHFTYIHEIGHTLGLPHSSGPYAEVYDSPWDVMSVGRWRPEGLSGLTGVHTIAYHKDLLGWIPAHRRHVAPAGVSAVVLEPINGGAAGVHPQIVVIPLPGGEFFTVETRRRTGYDAGAPADAVVIHHVMPLRNEPAQLVDADGNGDVSDDAVSWKAGETFRDRQRGVEVSIDAEAGDAFRLTITTPGVHTISVSTGDRSEIPFGTTAEIRDSAFVKLTGPDAAQLAWVARTASAHTVMESTSGTGSGWLRWRRPTASLAVGEHVEWISVSAAGADPRVIEFADTLVVVAPAGLAAGFSTIPRSDTLLVGQSRVDVPGMGFYTTELRVSGAGADTASWSVVRRPAWMEVTPSSGTGSTLLGTSRSANGMTPGMYADTLAIRVEGVADPVMLVHRMVVLAPIEIAPRHRAIAARLPESPMAVLDSVYLELRGDWAANAAVRTSLSAPLFATAELSAPRVGSGWVRFLRRTEGLQPGAYATPIVFTLLHDHEAGHTVTVIDTMHIDSEQTTLRLSRTSARDTAHVGEWSEGSVHVQPTGDNSSTRSWHAWPVVAGVPNIRRIHLLADRPTDLLAPEPPGPKPGARRVRWTRVLTERAPGLNVDTIHFDYASAPYARVTLIDSVWVIGTSRPPILITSDSIRPAALMGAAYTDSLVATGATDGLRWRLVTGALPQGVSLDSVSGRLGGVAESAGDFQFTVRAHADSRFATRAFHLEITKPVLQPSAILDQLLGSGSMTSDHLRFLDLLGNRNGRLDVGDVRAWLVDNNQLSDTQTLELRAIIDGAGLAPKTPPDTAAHHAAGGGTR